MDSKHRKHIIYIILSIIAMIECVITLLINVTDRTLKAKPSTAFANSLTASIWLLSAISLVSNLGVRSLPGHLSTTSLQQAPNEGSLPPAVPRLLGGSLSLLNTALRFRITYLVLEGPLHQLDLPGGLHRHLHARHSCYYSAVQPRCSGVPPGESWTRTGQGEDRTPPEEENSCISFKVLMLYICLGLPHTVYPLLMKLIKEEDKKVEDLLNEIFYYINRIQLLFFLPVYAWANTSFHHALNARARRLIMWLAALLADLCCDRRRNRIQSEESTQTESM
nr:uncharacterized protein LOC123750668 [Procambarus clarkii]